MSDRSVTELLEILSEPLISQSDFNCAFIAAYNFYCDNYHHLYSEISRFIFVDKNKNFHSSEVIKQNLIGILENIDSLLSQFEDLKADVKLENVKTSETSYLNVKNGLTKLYDHISLELIRLDFIGKSLYSVDETKDTVDLLNKEIKVIQKSYTSIKSNLERHKIELVTILGIFASIVITFTGTFSFSNSILSNFDKVSSVRLFLYLILIIGFVTNILFYLFYFLKKISNENSKFNLWFCIMANS